MIVKLDDDFQISVSSMNWTLQERYAGKDKDGNEVLRWRDLGYYPGLKAALTAIPDHLCGKLDSLTDVVDRLEQLANTLQRSVGK